MLKETVKLLIVNIELRKVHRSAVCHHSLRLEEFHPSHLRGTNGRAADRHTGRRRGDAVCLCPFLRLTGSGRSALHDPRRRTAGRHSHRRAACGHTHPHRRAADRHSSRRADSRNAVLCLIGTCCDRLRLRPVHDVKKISVIGFLHIGLHNLVEEVSCSCSVDQLDGEVLVAGLFSKLTIVMNILGANEFSSQDRCGMRYLLIRTVDKGVIH